MMSIGSDAKTYVWADGVTTFDPTGATVELEVAGVRYGMSWEAAAVQTGASWTRTARTTELFSGVDRADGVRLPAGRHLAKLIYTVGEQVIDTQPSVIVVMPSTT